MSLIGEIAGDMSILPGVTCWLYEGNITRATSESRTDLDTVTVLREDPLRPGDLVEIYDNPLFDYHALEGLPIVRRVSGSISAPYVGEILSQPDRALGIPQANGTISSLQAMIQYGYLRKATVEFHALTKMKVAEVVIPSSSPASSLEVGKPEQVVYSSSEEIFYFDPDETGQGAVPFHHITGLTNADKIGLTLLGFGMTPIKVVV